MSKKAISGKNGKSEGNPIEIPEEFLGLKDRSYHRATEFTPEMDAVITACWQTKNQSEFVKVFRAKYGFGSEKTIRARYRELMKEEQ